MSRLRPPSVRRFAWSRALSAPVAIALVLAACLERPVTTVEPLTTNQFFDKVVHDRVDKLDLLFMIDNSLSMADKQEILKQAVPVLLTRLVSPACVDEQGTPLGGNAPCSAGAPEFNPIRDIHIGVVTSNLGDMGATSAGACSVGDKGQLIATPALRETPLQNWNNQGFLAWDPDAEQGRGRHDPPGTISRTSLIGAFQDMVVAAGEQGCGYEASLESWYRFLIDPEPPASVGFELENNNTTSVMGVDTTILAQRAQFLRPDSLVAVIMLSDENDCSIADYGRGGRIGRTDLVMPRANSACERSADDPCCAPCDEEQPPGCPSREQDPVCAANPFLTEAEDNPNLRCYQQKRRFGRDFLQPVSRYIDGLTLPEIRNRKNEIVPNPLFQAPPGMEPRDRSLVFVAGITGVPWQDVSDSASWSDPKRLRYLSYEELEQQGRWEWMLGKPGEAPQDPFMVESPLDRTTLPIAQSHPSGVAGSLVPSSATARQSPINGHESNITDGRELQYACTFPMSRTPTCIDDDVGCDCSPQEAGYNRSLCEGNVQTHAKAFPGTRQLEVLRGVGQRTNNSIVASICPKVTVTPDPASDPDYGYNPAVNAIIDRLKGQFGAKCLPRQLEVDQDGQVPCVMLEARKPEPATACGACGGPGNEGRAPLDVPDLERAARSELALLGHCDAPGKPACGDYCLCEIEQLSGEALARCQREPQALSDVQGYCYVDAQPRPGEAADSDAVRARERSVAECPPTQRRLLRFTSEVPAKGSVAFISCQGRTLY